MESTLTFQQVKDISKEADAETAEASKELKRFPRLPMGITPDHVRKTQEWKDAQARFVKAFARSRSVNAFLVKNFKKELKEERDARNAERCARAPKP